MVREVLKFDIGLFPLFHLGDGRARGTLKAKVYMSAGCVAACEGFGENPKLVTDGENGVLCSSPAEWKEKLEWLVTHPEERNMIARRGLDTIQRQFKAEHMFAKLAAAFSALTND